MKSTAESPVKLPFKSDFTVKFECNSRYLRSFETKAATPKGPFRVRFPAGVPNKKEPTGSFLFGFRCGSEPVVRPIAQQWHERRATFGKPHAPICAKYSRRPPLLKKPTGSFLFGFRCGSEPVVRPIAQQWHERRATFGKPHAPICAKYSRRPPLLKRAYGLFFVWLSVRKPTRGSPHCAAMAQKAKRRQFSMRRGMFKPRRGWRRWAPFSPPSRRGRRSPQRR